MQKFRHFEEFWPYYLSQHQQPLCRVLHYSGSLAATALFAFALVKRRPSWLAWVPVCGYLPAWIGHFFIEKNRPATFSQPLYSLRADFRMLAHWLRRPLPSRAAASGEFAGKAAAAKAQNFK